MWEWINFFGLQPLGGAIIIKKLYLMNPCTDLHQILHTSAACCWKSMNQNSWTFATRDALGGATKMNNLFHTLPLVSAFQYSTCFFSITESTHVMIFMNGRGFMPL